MHKLLLLVGLCLPATATNQVFVDASATGTADGSSWQDAYTDLQLALAATPTGEIWVASGTYLPSQTSDQSASFVLSNGLEIYGGFAGSETNLSQRDVAANPTILSGDLDQDDIYGTGWNWWQFGWTGGANNSSRIVEGINLDSTARLDGFTILAGFAALQLDLGAGMFLSNSSPILANLTWEKNTMGVGSSLYSTGGRPVIQDSVIKDGYSFGYGPSGFYFTGGSQPVIEDCDFNNHYAVTTGGHTRGAALSFDFGTNGSVRRTKFVGNQTGNWFAAGDPEGSYGAGIYHLGTLLVVEDCTFDDNFADAGAGIYAMGSLTVTDSLFVNNLVHPYTVGIGIVTVGDAGAGIFAQGFGVKSLRVEGCTFTGNTAQKGAGVSANFNQKAIIRNTIIWGNQGPPPVPGEDLIWPLKEQITGNYDLAYCNVYFLLTTEPGEDAPNPADFPGCFDADPLFMPGTYHLGSLSPCIDAGNNGEVSVGNTVDLSGAPRFYDDPLVADTGLGTAPIVDLGSFEHQPTLPLSANTSAISLSTGGTQSLSISAPAHPSELYWLLGSTTGTAPGIPIDGLVIPLTLDPYMLQTITAPNQAHLIGSLGNLDLNGAATAAIVVSPSSNPSLAGLTLYHAFITVSGVISSSSNPVSLDLVP